MKFFDSSIFCVGEQPAAMQHSGQAALGHDTQLVLFLTYVVAVLSLRRALASCWSRPAKSDLLESSSSSSTSNNNNNNKASSGIKRVSKERPTATPAFDDATLAAFAIGGFVFAVTSCARLPLHGDTYEVNGRLVNSRRVTWFQKNEQSLIWGKESSTFEDLLAISSDSRSSNVLPVDYLTDEQPALPGLITEATSPRGAPPVALYYPQSTKEYRNKPPSHKERPPTTKTYQTGQVSRRDAVTLTTPAMFRKQSHDSRLEVGKIDFEKSDSVEVKTSPDDLDATRDSLESATIDDVDGIKLIRPRLASSRRGNEPENVDKGRGRRRKRIRFPCGGGPLIRSSSGDDCASSNRRAMGKNHIFSVK
jgi:hypothetical protein